MKTKIPINRRNGGQRGFALVIILAFVVLLTALVVAFFSRAIAKREISDSSTNQAKADLLARTATDIVVGNLKQEIVLGTQNPETVGTAPNQSTIYVPLPRANILPQRGAELPVYPTNGTIPTNPQNLLVNLIRKSVRTDAIASPGQSSLASSVSSTDPSLDGRIVSLPRWNSHYLLPRAKFGDGGTMSSPDSTPNGAFVAPDWVLVTRGGPQVIASVGSGTPASDSTPTNSKYVIGRYAFAIYDEGGTLDMNVAGGPTPRSTVATIGYTAAQASQKGAMALVDLTQLKSGDVSAAGTSFLTQAQVNQVVGWRNLASSSQSSGFPITAFSPSQADDWYKNFVTGDMSGHRQVFQTTSGSTDQAFLSRQQLLKLWSSLNLNEDVLQYLGTFSRALEQPSYVPNPDPDPTKIRPAVMTSSYNFNSYPPAPSQYFGNNDAQGTDTTPSMPINPSFLKVRVTIPFTRLDGTPAKAGDPLVKTRFALNRLSWITFDGRAPSSTAKTALLAAGIPQKMLDNATADNIRSYFGLTWDGGNYAWKYNHGADRIYRLNEVAGLGREPDFAELLKAAINVGSLGKAGPGLHDGEGNYQFLLDPSVDYHVIQIMANIIDQFDADSYPTPIEIQTSAGGYRVFRGIEDLPYFYRYHQISAVTQNPTPTLTATDVVKFADGSTHDHTRAGSVSGNAGKAVLLYVPDVWNPHDATQVLTNPTLAGSSLRPTQFRIYAVTGDPTTPTSATPSWGIGAQVSVAGISNSNVFPSSTPAHLDESNTGIQFTDNGGKLFREPTLLWQVGLPSGSNLASLTGTTFHDIPSGLNFIGILGGDPPIQFTYTDTDGKNYMMQGTGITKHDDLSAGGFENMTFRLKYQNGDGVWVTYDEKYPDFHSFTGNLPVIVNPTESPMTVTKAKDPTQSGIYGGVATGYDPRTARFGVGISAQYGPASTFRLDSTSPIGQFFVIQNQRPEADKGFSTFYSTPGMSSDANGGHNLEERFFSGRGFNASATATGNQAWPLFYDGLLSQNNPAVNTVPPRSNNSGTGTNQLYYEDPDGIARRAMGAYAAVPLTTSTGATGATTTFAGLPMVTATQFPGGKPASTGVTRNRPMILNRPFRSVAELGYTFRGELWRNLDFFTPESGDVALLDVFCINEPPVDGIVAGKINLNTRQSPVLQAVLAGAYRDEIANQPSLSSAGLPLSFFGMPGLTDIEVTNIAQQLIRVTTSTQPWRGPLINVSDLVGRYINNAASSNIDEYSYNRPGPAPGASVSPGNFSYSGFSAALFAAPIAGSPTLPMAPLVSVWDPKTSPPLNLTPYIQRMREAAIRPLADIGQTRVWNLMLDVVAQTGHYPPNSTKLQDFAVQGEKRYWVHVALDRYTGQVVDKQIEVVNE